ncbi:MAG: response regulator [Terracidiphilus sp.]|nr:response regulator [Terracidiphilus sp.]MDR3796879.1 response regulator [Terracidiphilus sp.]
MPQDGKKPRVFVVDDETIIATTLELILRRHGCKTYSFDRPLEALHFAHETPPDLLLSDVVMPVVSGIELAIKIREFCPTCKVLLFSGQSSTADLLARARANGHNFEVLTKPVHPTDLLRKLHAQIGI